MQAIILAAGMGKRLGDLTRDDTKCMVRVNGVRLVERMLDQLAGLGLSRAVLVVGYKRENLKAFVGNEWRGLPVEYVDNPVYDKTNNIYSLALAGDKLAEDDTILLESDLVLEDSILRRLRDAPYPNLACVDAFQSWMDGTVVVLGENDTIKRFVPKKDFVYGEIPSYYKTVNVYKFGREFSRDVYVPFLRAYASALGNNEYYEQVLRVIAMVDHSVMRAMPLHGEKWYEIDDVQDLDIAESMFCPPEEQVRRLHARYGGFWRYPGLKDFCYLVNPHFPPPNLLAEMKNSFLPLLTQYPSGMRVNALLAGKDFGVPPDMVVPGNGAAELIRALLERTPGRVGFVLPTFEEYPNRIPPERRVLFAPPAGNGFRYSARDLVSFFGRPENAVDSLVLVNPDNPSGNFLSETDVFFLADWAEERGIDFVLDESFVDFAEGHFTAIRPDVLSSRPRLRVVKSISKSYGVPGLRLGILASGDKDLVAALKKDVSIWNLNSFAEFFLQIVEKYQKEYRRACELFRDDRKKLLEGLRKVPFLRVFPSEANYFLCEVLPPWTSGGLAVRLWKDASILVKDCAGKAGFGGRNFVRVAVRDEKDNAALLAALEALA